MLVAMAELAEKLVALRKAAGLTQQDLAQAAGLSVSIVVKLEIGKTADPRASTLRALARALGVTVNDLLGDEPSAPRRRRRKKDTD